MQINNTKLVLGIGVLLLLTSLARADWSADVQIKTKKGEDMAGKAFGRPKDGLMRLDINSDHRQMSVIVDHKSKKATMLMHEQKMIMESDLTKSRVEVPPCDMSNFESCLAAEGFKKTGS